MKDHAKDQAGFTLIEVLVSLALLAVLSLYMLQAFRLQGKMDKATLRIERQLEIRSARELLQAEISAMQLAFLPDQQGQQQLVFDGKTDTLSFAILSDGTRFEGGLYRLTLFVNTEKTLLARFAGLHGNSGAQTIAIPVLSNVESMDITYRGDDSGPEWQTQWTATNKQPLHVRLMISLNDAQVSAASQNSFVVLVNVALAQ